MTPERYADYLKSEQWALRRDLVMERAGGRCEGCRLNPASEVHHRTYEHVTQEFLFELVALCGDCHDRIHAKPDQPPTPTWQPRLAGTPRNRATRHTLAELAAIHRKKWMGLTTEQQQERQAAILRGETLPPPPDGIPEAMEAET
jgi:cytochrome c553